MCVSNPTWGAPRIHGELLKLGIDVSRTTVSKYIVRRPKPPSQTWRAFLDNHVKQLVRYLPNRLFHDITRFTLTVNKGEADQLVQEFRAYGYSLRRDREKQIATGLEIEFVMLPAAPDSPRKLAIDVALNHAKRGDQVYQFGRGSDLRFSDDNTARWTFPAGWRP